MGDNYKIVMTSHGSGTVYKNGEKLDNVIAIEFSAKVNEINTVKITFVAKSVEIETVAEEL